MAKILLVNCIGFNEFLRGKDRYFYYMPPLGIGYLGAYLRKNGFDVKLLELGMLHGWQEFIEILADYNPRIIGLSAMTSEAENAYQAAEIVHRTIKDAAVVMGGPHATICPADAISNPYVDFIVRGEGEITFFELCQALIDGGDVAGVDGITYKQGHAVRTNRPRGPVARLDDLPFPARDITGAEGFHIDAYNLLFPMPYPYINIMASRGCLARCSMCQPALEMIFGKGMRQRSAANVIEEIKLLKEAYKIRSVIFWDDTFTMNQKWLDEFCNVLSEARLNISWWCYGRADTVHEGMLRKMKKAGCVMICFGIESGSQRVLTEVLNKGTTVEQNRTAIALCKKAGILVNANVMFGSPTETLNEIRLTDLFLEETEPELVWPAVTSPSPGTALGEEARRKGLIVAEKWSDYSRNYTDSPKLKTDVPSETILFYYAKWLMLGFKWKFVLEPHYLRACMARWICHIKIGKPARVYDDILQAVWVPIKEGLQKVPFIYKSYLKYKQWRRSK